MRAFILAILSTFIIFYFNSCSNSCPDLLCISSFSGGRVLLKDFNLQQNDSVVYVKYPKGNLQAPLDSFFVRVDISQNSGNTPNEVRVSPSSKFSIQNDWKIIVPSKKEYTLTDIKVFPKECAKCTFGHTFYDEYEVKVNGETQTGRVVIIK